MISCVRAPSKAPRISSEYFNGTDSRFRSEAFDALLIDVVFKDGMSGIETAKLVREVDPSIKIVVMSVVDYSFEIRQEVVNLGGTFVEKPIPVERILGILGLTR